MIYKDTGNKIIQDIFKSGNFVAPNTARITNHNSWNTPADYPSCETLFRGV